VVALKGSNEDIHKMLSQIKQIENDIKYLKRSLKKEAKVPAIKLTTEFVLLPMSIDLCTKRQMLEQFTVVELKQWVKMNNIEVRMASDKVKDDWITIVWRNLKKL
jgi:hypothetical protein